METSLLLVLGAGASKEFGLPTGTELKSKITSLLDIRFEYGFRQKSGDPQIVEAWSLIKFEEKDQSDSFPLACKKICDAMPQAISIDNFIDCHAHDPKITICGKLAIAKAILDAEAKSILTINRRHIENKIYFSQMPETWLNGFFQILTENCQVENLPNRLKSVKVITFNYDRCFEHYLFHAIMNYYSIPAEKTVELLQNIEIHHPYGMVGCLPWMSREPSIDFGSEIDTEKLVRVSRQIRTFTEGTNPKDSPIVEIRATIRGTKKFVFLGFGFHKLNMDLLFGASKEVPLPTTFDGIFGTALGISSNNCNAIAAELSNKTGLAREIIQLRNDLNCTKLIQEYSRNLSLV